MPGPSSSDPIVNAFASAIATAEGFGRAGAIPTTNNNPGDLKIPGTATGGGSTIFGSPQDGWDALTTQAQLMLYGGSSFYNPSMTLAQAGSIYSGGDPNWAANVAAGLGVSVDTPLSAIAAGVQPFSGSTASYTSDGGSLVEDFGGLSPGEGIALLVGGVIVLWLLVEAIF